MDNNYKKLFQELSKIGVEKQYKSFKVVVQPGDKVNKIHLVKKGGLVLTHVHPITAKEKCVNFFTPDFNPIATVVQSYGFNEPSKYKLKTFTNTDLIEIDKPTLDEFLKNSELAPQIYKLTIENLIEKNELRVNLITLSSEEMFTHLHNNFPYILQQVPSKYIADFLGITPQWVSKLKHSLNIRNKD